MNLPEVPRAVTPLSYRGDAWKLTRLELQMWVLSFFTLGLGHPWAKARLRRYVWAHVYVGETPLHWLAGSWDQARTQTPISKLLLAGFVLRSASICFFLTHLWVQLTDLGTLLVLAPSHASASQRILELSADSLSLDVSQWLLAIFAYMSTPIYQLLGQKFELHYTELHGIRFGQDAPLWPYVKLYVRGFIATGLTLGLAYPAWSVEMRAYLINQSRYGDVPCRYTGSASDIRGSYVWGFLACVLTCGAYYPWHIAKLRNYHASQTHLGPLRLHGQQDGATLSNVLALNFFIYLATLGAASGWARTRTLHYQMQHLTLIGDAHSVLVRPGPIAQPDGMPDLLSMIPCSVFGA